VVGKPTAVSGKENFYYVVSKKKEWTEVLLPFDALV
jgi:hypothetical protein